MSLTVLALGGADTGIIVVADSWFQLLLAGALAVLFAQFAFFAHDAAHRQVFVSGRPTGPGSSTAHCRPG